MNAKRPLILLLLASLWLAACRAPAAQAPAANQPNAPTATTIPQPENTPTATRPAEELLAIAQDTANRGQWQEAILLLDLAIEQEPENAQAYLRRGDAYLQLDDSEQALSNYDQATTIDPNLAEAYNAKGLLYFDRGEMQPALDNFAKAIELAPTYALAYRNRAQVQIALGNASAAALDLQIYLTFVPNALDKATVEGQIADLQEQVVQAAAEDGLLFSDDFSDTASGWYTNGDPSNVGLYAGDGYVLQVSAADGGAGTVWAMPGRLYSDVRLEVTARKQNGSDNNFYGLMCRISNTGPSASFYAFLVSSDGYYVVAKRVAEKELQGVGQDKLLPTSLINQGEASNKITAICSGQRLALYVNDELVFETTDDDLTSGQVGVIAGSYEDSSSIIFDDFAVYTEPAQ